MLNQVPSPSLFYFVYKWHGKIDQLPLQRRTYLIVNSIEGNYSCEDVWRENLLIYIADNISTQTQHKTHLSHV